MINLIPTIGDSSSLNSGQSIYVLYPHESLIQQASIYHPCVYCVNPNGCEGEQSVLFTIYMNGTTSFWPRGIHLTIRPEHNAQSKYPFKRTQYTTLRVFAGLTCRSRLVWCLSNLCTITPCVLACGFKNAFNKTTHIRRSGTSSTARCADCH